tara:strand:- start:2805 stop:2993 length:189 start_codon:yes stop_codon:yes gene_type:complete
VGITVDNIDRATREVNLRYNNFKIIKVSENEVRWKDRDSDKTLAIMEDKEGTLNFKRLWKQV